MKVREEGIEVETWSSIKTKKKQFLWKPISPQTTSLAIFTKFAKRTSAPLLFHGEERRGQRFRN